MSLINLPEYEVLIGLTKEAVLEQFGFCFNDFISNIWMFRLETKNCFFCKKYLYLFFENNIVINIEIKRYKANYLMWYLQDLLWKYSMLEIFTIKPIKIDLIVNIILKVNY